MVNSRARGVREAREHVGHEIREARQHTGHEARETREHVGHETCEAQEHVEHEAREAREHVGDVIWQTRSKELKLQKREYYILVFINLELL